MDRRYLIENVNAELRVVRELHNESFRYRIATVTPTYFAHGDPTGDIVPIEDAMPAGHSIEELKAAIEQQYARMMAALDKPVLRVREMSLVEVEKKGG